MTVSRRVFLQVSAMGGAAATTSGALAGCGNRVDPAPVADFSVEEDPASLRYGQVAVVIARYPDLVPVGGAISMRLAPLRRGDHPFTLPEGGVLLVHRGDEDPRFVATGALCTHQGCPLGYSATDELIECPCHGSRFRPIADPKDLMSCVGQPVHLPARGSLTVWGTALSNDGTTLFVDLRTPLSCSTSGFPPVVAGAVTLRFGQFPELRTVGGSVIGQPSGLSDTLIVVRESDARAVALSAICTHRMCAVEYAPEDRRFECPCHQTIYDLEGMVTEGPAPRPLRGYSARIDGEAIIVTVVA